VARAPAGAIGHPTGMARETSIRAEESSELNGRPTESRGTKKGAHYAEPIKPPPEFAPLL
ncbi:hypothetical protein J5H41_22510, partial [Aeromonas dhakensis]|uniref:hypothetical protein n=1 Tax=Aeromonas dhakensis TaxID=196024 RepID=UPI001AAE3B8C